MTMFVKDLLTVLSFFALSVLAYFSGINWLSVIFALMGIGMAGFIIWVVFR